MNAVSQVRAELARVGVSYGKAGVADYVAIDVTGDDQITFLGPPRLPRRSWRGETGEALRRLRALADDVGVETFWMAFATYLVGGFEQNRTVRSSSSRYAFQPSAPGSA